MTTTTVVVLWPSNPGVVVRTVLVYAAVPDVLVIVASGAAQRH